MHACTSFDGYGSPNSNDILCRLKKNKFSFMDAFKLIENE